MATCRDCAHYDREAFRQSNGRIVFRKDKAARCLFKLGRIVQKLPHSVTQSGMFRVPLVSHMEPDEGSGCPQWTRIEEGQP